MSSHKVETHWMGAMQFNALVQDHVVVMDAPERTAGHDNGPIPKPLVLTALTGYTGMDVVAILRKQGHTLHDFTLVAEGELSKKSPLYYTSVHLTYKVAGDDGVAEPLTAAVLKSQEEICGVSYMLRQSSELSYSIELNGIEIHRASFAQQEAAA